MFVLTVSTFYNDLFQRKQDELMSVCLFNKDTVEVRDEPWQGLSTQPSFNFLLINFRTSKK